MRQIKFSSDKELPLIFNDQRNQPDQIFLSYMLFKLRFKTASTTINNSAYSLLQFYRYLDKYGDSMFALLFQKAESLQSRIDGFTYYFLENISSKNQSFSYRNLVLNSLKEFFTFINQEYHTKIDLINLKSFIVAKSNKPNLNKNLDSEIIQSLLQISDPDNDLNPFKDDQDLRLRNFLIVLILVETGIRIGELMSITVHNYTELNGRFYLEINGSDLREDTRHSKGRIKNSHSFRTISISKECFLILHKYVTSIRTRLLSKKSISHNFLLISEKGNPISKHAICNILKSLSTTIGLIMKEEIDIKPHDFRYSFANRFLSYLIEIQGLEIERAKDELRAIMGWTINSQMPSKYAAFYFTQKADISNFKRIESVYKYEGISI